MLKNILHFSLFLILYSFCLPAQSIHWQVSETPDFDWVHPELDRTISLHEEINLDKVVESLCPNETYFLRYKIEDNHNGSDWSVPIPFKQPIPENPEKQLSWPKNNFISEAVWSEIDPYLLPANHPIRPKLDEIFQKSRVIADEKSLKKNGFDFIARRKWDNAIVAWHSKLKGYLIKLYLDEQLGIDEKLAFKTRMEGAEYIRHFIQTNEHQNLFKVPKKWLYPLPENPPANPGAQRKNFILVEEDMNLVNESTNSKKWKTAITKEHLKALYSLLQTLGLKDSVYITNIPFAKDGKIAFIDTEHHHKWPVNFLKLIGSLNPDMQAYWHTLILTNGQ